MKVNPSIVCTALIAVGIGLIIGKKGLFFSPNDSDQKAYSIAIMLPVSHAALEEIQQGFVDTIKQEIVVHYDVYNAQGDRTLMRTQAEQIVQQKYDLVFAIATQPALMIKEVTAQRGSIIPIVAGAVDDPVENRLIASMESSSNNVTAVTSELGEEFIKKYVTIATFLKPTMKHVLIPYTVTPALERDKNNLVMFLKKQGIVVTEFPVVSVQDMLQKIPLKMDGQDAIFVLRDNTVVSALEALSTLCNRHHVTLFALDLNSVEKGAAVGYGVKEYDFGVESGRRALQILEKKNDPSSVSSGVVKNFRLKLNQNIMKQQNLLLEPGLLYALSSCEIIPGVM